MKLTPASIKALTLPVGVSEKTYFDDLAGFGVRARASGGRSYVVQYKTHGKNRRVVLGAVEFSTSARRARPPGTSWPPSGLVGIPQARGWNGSTRSPAPSACCCRGTWSGNAAS